MNSWGRVREIRLLAGGTLLAGGCCLSVSAPFVQPPCATDAGVVTLFTSSATLNSLVPNGNGLLVGGAAGIESVPFSGAPTSLTSLPATNLFITGDEVVFSAYRGGSGIYTLALDGGTATPVFNSLGFGYPNAETINGNALMDFFGPHMIEGLNIPDGSTFLVPIPGSYLVNAMSLYGGWIYATATNLAVQPTGSFANGVIFRAPTMGGAIDGSSTQTLLSGIGNATTLAVADTGLFWSEAPTVPSSPGVGSTRHANLDGSLASTLLDQPATSLAVSGSTLLYGGVDGTVGAIDIAGSEKVTLASGLVNPKVLVSGGNVVWLDEGNGSSADGGAPAIVATTCIP